MNHHRSSDDLNRYHLGRVQEPELAVIEEYLLWCHGCRDRAEENLRSI